MLPPTFNGSIACRTKRGSVDFLPGFAKLAQVLRGTDREMFVDFAPPSKDAVPPVTLQREDSCVVSTRAGRIIIGLSGVDKVPSAGQLGLFQVLGEYLQAGVKAVEKRMIDQIASRMPVNAVTSV